MEADNDLIPALALPLSTLGATGLRTVALHLKTHIVSFTEFVTGYSSRWSTLDVALSNVRSLERVTVRLRVSPGD